ncbi:MAG: discoidin domain-containing protein, partial [Lachnospiraceae bacterium]|nr:discoidin domain-containing protein [Lachnospiraceae bacterium]
MLKQLRHKLQFKKTDNKGAGMVVVILTIAFVGMLVAMAVYMSFINFRMKFTDRSAKDNFYSAESALDEINAGLQSEISEIMTNTYADVMKSTPDVSEEQKTGDFKTRFKAAFKERCNPVDAMSKNTPEKFLEHLTNFLVETPVLGRKPSPSEEPYKYGAQLSLQDNGEALYKRYIESDDYITLKGIRITYANENGYVSIIETDIVITIPTINFATSVSIPGLQMFSLVANKSLEKHDGLAVEINGSVYGGGEDGIVVENPEAEIDFKLKDKDVGAGQPASEFYVVADSINVLNNGIIKSGELPAAEIKNESTGKHEIWTNDINVTTAKLDLDGRMYVKDDLNLDGTDYNGDGSVVRLAGSYIGYGDGADTAAQSSSILINGAQTTLNMRDLKELVLAGHAYVGTMHYDANVEAESSYIENLAKQNAGLEETEETDEEGEQTENKPVSGVRSVCPVHGEFEGYYKNCPQTWDEYTYSDIPLSSTNIIDASDPWRNGNGVLVDPAYKAVDGNLNTFFDGLRGGYIVLDLGKEYTLGQISFWVREKGNNDQFSRRLAGTVISGSKDNKNWEAIYTIKEEEVFHKLKTEECIVPEASFSSSNMNHKYRYIRFVAYDDGSTNNYALNITEIKLKYKETEKKYCNKEMTIIREGDYERNTQDIMLGQSIAVKSDQLIYMVPKECMCYDTVTNQQVLAKNPLTYEEYLKY